MPHFVEIGEQEHSLHAIWLFGAKKKKNTKKIRLVSGGRISGTAGSIPLKCGM